MDEPPFALSMRLALPASIIAKGGSFSTVSMLRLYSSTSLTCVFLMKKTPAAYDLTPRGFSIVRFVLQHLLGERPIEELDEGPKAERTDQGAKAHKATQRPAQ